MISTCIEKLPCKDCDSSDSVQSYLNVDEDLGIESYSSFCFGQCYEQKGDPYSGIQKKPTVSVKTDEDKLNEVRDIYKSVPFRPTKPYRSIRPSVISTFGIRVWFSEYTGKPQGIAFPLSKDGELRAYKCRPFRKKEFFHKGLPRGIDPFGFERALKIGGKILYITEGEFDAIALDDILGDGKSPVISLTAGGGSVIRDIENIRSRVISAGFKRVYTLFDDDEVGNLATQHALDNFKGIKAIPMPSGCKDANDVLKAGKGNQLLRSIRE